MARWVVVWGGILFALAGCAASRQSNDLRSASVWMQKPDGSKMCGFEKGVEPQKIADQLKSLGISVLRARQGSDGMMHMMVCGGPTGKTVDIEVPEAEVERVKKLGFLPKQ